MKIGIIGDGFIGQELAQRVMRGEPVTELCGVLSRSRRGAARIAGTLVVANVEELLARGPELVVEAAGAAVSTRWGERILAQCDYMPLSLCALVDDALRGRLLRTAANAATRLLVPHGAVVGLDSLVEWREQWASLVITFRKHPRNIDFESSGLRPPSGNGEALVFAATVRAIAERFPRNVNAMVACALATRGLDGCQARLFSDPGLDRAILELEAAGYDGSRIVIRREQPVHGVSGSEMAASLWRSITAVAGRSSVLEFL